MYPLCGPPVLDPAKSLDTQAQSRYEQGSCALKVRLILSVCECVAVR
jgi:hypothetical protein